MRQKYVELAWNFCDYKYKIINLFLWVHAATFVLELESVNILNVITSSWLQWEMRLFSVSQVWDFCYYVLLLMLLTQFKTSFKVIKLLSSVFVEFNFECKESHCSLLKHKYFFYSNVHWVDDYLLQFPILVTR